MNICIDLLSDSYIYVLYQNIVPSQKETDDLHCQKHQQNLLMTDVNLVLL